MRPRLLGPEQGPLKAATDSVPGQGKTDFLYSHNVFLACKANVRRYFTIHVDLNLGFNGFLKNSRLFSLNFCYQLEIQFANVAVKEVPLAAAAGEYSIKHGMLSEFL